MGVATACSLVPRSIPSFSMLHASYCLFQCTVLELGGGEEGGSSMYVGGIHV